VSINLADPATSAPLFRAHQIKAVRHSFSKCGFRVEIEDGRTAWFTEEELLSWPKPLFDTLMQRWRDGGYGQL